MEADKCESVATETEAHSNVMNGPHQRDDKPRPYQCTVCDKRFRIKRSLHDHKSKHRGERLYSCAQCQKHFTSQSTLSQHMNIHTRKFSCT